MKSNFNETSTPKVLQILSDYAYSEYLINFDYDVNLIKKQSIELIHLKNELQKLLNKSEVDLKKCKTTTFKGTISNFQFEIAALLEKVENIQKVQKIQLKSLQENKNKEMSKNNFLRQFKDKKPKTQIKALKNQALIRLKFIFKNQSDFFNFLKKNKQNIPELFNTNTDLDNFAKKLYRVKKSFSKPDKI